MLEPAKILADELKARGFDIWWDINIGSGQRFNDVIRQQLEEADAVIVIWSPASITSQYVKMEAGIAYGWDKLITVRTPELRSSCAGLRGEAGLRRI
jgi:TIR domain